MATPIIGDQLGRWRAAPRSISAFHFVTACSQSAVRRLVQLFCFANLASMSLSDSRMPMIGIPRQSRPGWQAPTACGAVIREHRDLARRPVRRMQNVHPSWMTRKTKVFVFR
jgi:hypothetical protein